MEGRAAARLRKLPTPVLSGSGSRVFLSPAILRSTPVSMIQLKHRGRRKANGAREQYFVAKSRTSGEFCRSLDGAEAGGRGRSSQRSDRSAGEDFHHGFLRFNPNRMRGTPRLAGAGPAGDEAEVKTDGAVDGLDDLAHGCHGAALGNVKTAQLTAARGDEPGAREGLQDFREKALRRACGARQIGK